MKILYYNGHIYQHDEEEFLNWLLIDDITGFIDDIASEDDKNVGDLIISLGYIKDLCEQEHKTINEHLRTLLCHGICHLLGYDHYTESTDKIMKEKESWLAAQLAEE